MSWPPRRRSIEVELYYYWSTTILDNYILVTGWWMADAPPATTIAAAKRVGLASVIRQSFSFARKSWHTTIGYSPSIGDDDGKGDKINNSNVRLRTLHLVHPPRTRLPHWLCDLITCLSMIGAGVECLEISFDQSSTTPHWSIIFFLLLLSLGCGIGRSSSALICGSLGDSSPRWTKSKMWVGSNEKIN